LAFLRGEPVLNLSFRRIAIVTFLIFSLGIFVPSRLALGSGTESVAARGELAAYGEVAIDGDPAASGTAVFSGSTISTIKDSTAVVTFGALGRLELLPLSSVSVSFSGNMLTCNAMSGLIRFSFPKGSSAKVTTKDGAVLAGPGEDTRFAIAVGGETIVSPFVGSLTIENGGHIRQAPSQAVFRSTIGESGATVAAAHVANIPKSTPASNLAAVLISIGTVIAAVTGFASPKHESFFSVGGMPAIEAAGSR
jgi:hypothetical protein